MSSISNNSKLRHLASKFIACITFSFVTANQFCPRGSEEDNFIGKAYIISTKLQIPQYTLEAAVACGFQPQILPAVLPFGEQYENSREKNCSVITVFLKR